VKKSRKVENTVFAFFIFGAIFMLPPLINIFNKPIKIFDLPLIVVFLFSLWVILILGTFFLSNNLKRNNTLNKPKVDIDEGEN